MPIRAIASSSPAPPSSGVSPWKQRTSTPTAAPTVTRFSATASSASTGERNAASRTRKVTSESTSTSGMKRLLVAWSKSSRTTAGPADHGGRAASRARVCVGLALQRRTQRGALLGRTAPVAGRRSRARCCRRTSRSSRTRRSSACWGFGALDRREHEVARSPRRGSRSVPLRFSCACRLSFVERTRTTLASMRLSARPIWLVPAVARAELARERLRAVVPVRAVRAASTGRR